MILKTNKKQKRTSAITNTSLKMYEWQIPRGSVHGKQYAKPSFSSEHMHVIAYDVDMYQSPC